jgi:hypothetical protein
MPRLIRDLKISRNIGAVPWVGEALGLQDRIVSA